ncbi:transcription initiation factor TFIID subunit 7-like [Daphnia pulicaria]|uniref:transcription initiation factor TFIID subunit 7-like n=1 Tax=Daphnia pulicaria TaxID=35523 RepID=UPI001EEBBA79|nr:transcription initiation factor TFIID subunit 7-like [Daphnia pulicaria]
MNRPTVLPPSSSNDNGGDELENQFILRLPPTLPECAESLRQTLRTGVMNLKDRLNIRMDNDMRKGQVQFDNWTMSAKVLDLPCVMESQKTIDNKTFYKAADVSQILICKEGEQQSSSEEETPVKPKKKDPHKVDKKFLMPHGIAPPMKNVRKRRFRKTLKKKYVEAPEIEKEVRRLLRVDNEAVSVRWELITEEDENKVKAANEAGLGDGAAMTVPLASGTFVSTQNRGLAEHDIFGEALSDSDEEHGSKINIMESDYENSDESRGSGSEFYAGSNRGSNSMITQFSGDMFRDDSSSSNLSPQKKVIDTQKDDLQKMADKLRDEIREIKNMRQAQENELATIENAALKQRFQMALSKLVAQEQEKKEEYDQIMSML